MPSTKFEPVITRSFKPPKPDPAGILHIASQWGVPKEERASAMIMVGDSFDDIYAGAAAGAVTVLLVNSENKELQKYEGLDTAISR